MPPRSRKASELVNSAAKAVNSPVTPSKRAVKRKAVAQQSDSGSDFEATPSKRQRSTRKASSSPKKGNVEAIGDVANTGPPPAAPNVDWSVELPSFLPAKLSFSYEEAQKHLIAADPRFEAMFEKLPCKPFVTLERVEPFRTLVTSIIGQQVSWRAARNIAWRMCRLYDDSLPEVVPPPESYSPPERFPPPHVVAETDIATLRSAGLSGAKAKYIQDVARHFADGKLSADKLWSATDEELYESLIAVKGIGPWTVNMFSMFSLRRPDILPVGDLGVQRGLLRFILSQHTNPGSPVKLSTKAAPEEVAASQTADEPIDATMNVTAATGSMAPPPPKTPTKKRRGTDEEDADYPIPPPFTPSINRVLTAPVMPSPLPAGLTIANLRARLTGKNKIKGAYLTPQEMEHFTEPWKPYRSIGVWYMWSLIDED